MLKDSYNIFISIFGMKSSSPSNRFRHIRPYMTPFFDTSESVFESRPDQNFYRKCAANQAAMQSGGKRAGDGES